MVGGGQGGKNKQTKEPAWLGRVGRKKKETVWCIQETIDTYLNLEDRVQQKALLRHLNLAIGNT